eukprot:scaffold9231_cov79-Skeletonema_dohrnii-CCMP3373.AAC.1
MESQLRLSADNSYVADTWSSVLSPAPGVPDAKVTCYNFVLHQAKRNIHNRRQFEQSQTITISNMTSTEVLQSVSYLLGLIEACEWETFRSFTLEPSPAHFRARTNVIAQTPELNGMTLLHAALKCDPPPELVLT